jgi:hypothetical protein
MITVDDIVSDGDMVAPAPWTIERSSGQWVSGGFQSVTTPIQVIGPVRVASDKEIRMLPEADRVGSIRSFYATQEIYTTRGHAPAQVPQTVLVTGTGTAFSLPAVPQGGVVQLIKNGALLVPLTDYTLVGNQLTLAVPLVSTDVLTYEYLATQFIEASASDLIRFDGFQYRVLAVYHTPGSAYWKAMATRLAAS